MRAQRVVAACVFCALMASIVPAYGLADTADGFKEESVAKAGELTVFETPAELSEPQLSGDAEAQKQLGICYSYKKGVKKDVDEAVKWLKKAAEQGNEEAKKELELIV